MTSKKMTISEDQLDELVQRKIWEAANPPAFPNEHCLGCYNWTTERGADGDAYCHQCREDGYAGNPQWNYITARKLGWKKGMGVPLDIALRIATLKRCTEKEVYEQDVEILAQWYDELMLHTDERHPRPMTPLEKEEAARILAARQKEDKIRALKSKINASVKIVADHQQRLAEWKKELGELEPSDETDVPSH